MRKLQTKDVFSALRIIKKVGLKEEMKPVFKLAASGELGVEDIGVEGMLTVIEIFAEHKAETCLYEVLSGPFEMTIEEVGEMNINDLLVNIQEMASENDLKSFFSSLVGMIGKK